MTVCAVLVLCVAASQVQLGAVAQRQTTPTPKHSTAYKRGKPGHSFVAACMGPGSDRSFSCRPEEAGADDLGSNNKSFQELVFGTLYTLTKNKTMDTSLRVAGLRILLEFLQVGCAELCCAVQLGAQPYPRTGIF
jgi:hypothetical protein